MDHWVSEVSPVRSGRDHTGKFKRQSAGRLGSPAGPAVSFSTGGVMGQCYSETQLSVQSLYLLIHWYTLILVYEEEVILHSLYSEAPNDDTVSF